MPRKQTHTWRWLPITGLNRFSATWPPAMKRLGRRAGWIQQKQLPDARAPCRKNGRAQCHAATELREVSVPKDPEKTYQYWRDVYDREGSLYPLPRCRYDVAKRFERKINPYSTVRFDTNNYLGPVQHCGKNVSVRGVPGRVEIFYNGEKIASHQRCFQH